MKKEYPWINHDGSNNIPCLPETLIDVLFRDGTICQNVFANKWYWAWDKQTLADDDIIAWKYNHNHKNQIKTIEIDGNAYELDVENALTSGLLKKPVNISIGDRFRQNSSIYLLCQIAYRQVMLINIQTGQRITNLRFEVGDPQKITKDEWERICQGEIFEKIS
jgi:hypothetical protein